jgi:two-component system, cell cycle response regulator
VTVQSIALKSVPEAHLPTPLEPVRFLTSPPLVERAGKVVVVDPSSDRRKQLRKMLEGDGRECVLLSDGDELLRVCAEFEPDLLLIAVDLPSGSGLELCGDVRASDPGRHLPLILLGEKADEQHVAAGLMAGADDFVTDLSRAGELRARIHVQLRNKRLLDTLQRVRSERDLLRRDAQIDALTGLLNRRSLENEANERWLARDRFGILFMDLDHFKSVNDRFGHEIGDRVLMAVANVLRAGLRPGDVIARFGGEEFVALIAGAGPESARLVGERLRRHIEEMPPMHRGPRRITISVGATVFDPQRSEEAPPEILRRADVALYAAKHGGRNRVVLMPAGALVPEGSVETPASHTTVSLPPRSDGATPPGEASSR